MSESHIPHDTPNGETRSKLSYIRKLRALNPQMSAKEIAEKAGTTTGYAYNVLSKTRRKSEIERGREDRGNATIHGQCSYQVEVLPEWYNQFDVPIMNAKTGMKQLGFVKYGDPCSCQLHMNG